MNRSSPRARHRCELTRNGRIGKVKEVYVGRIGGPPAPTLLPAEDVPLAARKVPSLSLTHTRQELTDEGNIVFLACRIQQVTTSKMSLLSSESQ